MNDVFPDLVGYETQTEFMQKRTLLEFIMIKHVIEEDYAVPLETILNEADISVSDKPNIGLFLKKISKNGVVILNPPDLHDRSITSTDLDVMMICKQFHVEKWINKVTDKKEIHSFSSLEQEERDQLIAELVEKITQMKKIISSK